MITFFLSISTPIFSHTASAISFSVTLPKSFPPSPSLCLNSMYDFSIFSFFAFASFISSCFLYFIASVFPLASFTDLLSASTAIFFGSKKFLAYPSDTSIICNFFKFFIYFFLCQSIQTGCWLI